MANWQRGCVSCLCRAEDVERELDSSRQAERDLRLCPLFNVMCLQCCSWETLLDCCLAWPPGAAWVVRRSRPGLLNNWVFNAVFSQSFASKFQWHMVVAIDDLVMREDDSDKRLNNARFICGDA